MRCVGTVSRGIRLPVITKGEDIVKIISDSVLEAAKSERDAFTIRDRDIVGVTESLVARSQGNYVTLTNMSDHDIDRNFVFRQNFYGFQFVFCSAGSRFHFSSKLLIDGGNAKRNGHKILFG